MTNDKNKIGFISVSVTMFQVVPPDLDLDRQEKSHIFLGQYLFHHPFFRTFLIVLFSRFLAT